MEAKKKIRGDFGISNHYVICNWSEKADFVIRQLHEESVNNPSPIIIITNHPERVPKSIDDEYKGVLIISGDPASKEILLRADIEKAKAVIILADDNNIEESDSKAILIALAIDSIAASTHSIVELMHAKNQMYFQYTHVNEVVCLEELGVKVLSQAALTPGLSKVFLDLLTQSEDSNEVYQEKVPSVFVGKTYEDMEVEIVKIEVKDIILIGYSTSTIKKDERGECIKDSRGECIDIKKTVINPESSTTEKYSKSHIMEDDDNIFLIAYSKPELNNYFNTLFNKEIKKVDLK